MKRIIINVNGVDRPLIVDPAKKLADVLRDQLVTHVDDLVSPRPDVALIDEADSVLVDEALVPLVLAGIVNRFPWLRHLFADGGYAGDKLRDALRKIGTWTLDIVKRSNKTKGFQVLPRRWVVERTLAWLSRNRRLAKDFEQTIASATAWLFIASIQLFTRRIARLSNYTG